MIVQFGQPSPWQVGQSSRRLYSPRSVGIGTRPRRWAIISSKSGPTLSYSLPSSARIGPRWNSTSSIAIFGTSATRTRRKAFAYAGSVSSISSRIASGAADRTLIFISDPPPPAASLRLRAVVRDRGHFLDPPDAQSGAGERADGRLGPGTRGLRTVPARSAHADVDRIDALLLRGIRHAFRSLHRRIRRRLVLRRLHDHPAGRLRDRLGSGQIGQGDDDVVVRRVDVRDPPSWHGSSLRLVRGRCSRLVTGQVGPFLALGGDRPGDLALLADRMEVARDRGPLVVGDPGLLRPADEDAGDRDPPASDRHMTVDDELPRLPRCEGEALEERERLEAPRQDRLHIEGQDVVEGRALERQEAEATEAPEQLLPLLLRLLVPRADPRLELPRPLPEPAQHVLGAPQFLLVLQPVFLQEFVLRLDPLRLPGIGGPFELRAGKFRIAQRFTPSLPASSPLSSLPSSRRLPPPSSPGRRRGRPSSSPRRSGRSGRSTGSAARGPSARSHGGRPCTIGSSSCG